MESVPQNIVIAIISYVLGIFSGIIASKYMQKKGLDKLVSDGGNQMVLLIVTSIWFVSMIIDILSPEYETSPYVHGLMGAIVGFFYRKQGEKGEKNEK